MAQLNMDKTEIIITRAFIHKQISYWHCWYFHQTQYCTFVLGLMKYSL